jgi:ribose-phosphate pyrophosphokinase
MAEGFAIICGNANRALAASIASAAGVALGDALVERFPDGEVSVDIRESVRDKDVFIIQSTAPPVNDHLMELLAMVDACRRASAARIFAVIPYFGYARSDKRHGRREPISARLVADLLQTAGTDHVITIDLHASQIEGFFRIPVESLTAVSILCDALKRRLPSDTVVVSPDAGRLKMATDYAQNLNTSVVLLHKTRDTGADAHVTHLVGDVRGRPCLVVDDMISTGGTIVEAVNKLVDMGARPDIAVAATHGLLVSGAQARLTAVPIGDVFVTDSIEQRTEGWTRLHAVSVGPPLADAIRRLASSEVDEGFPRLGVSAPAGLRELKRQLPR